MSRAGLAAVTAFSFLFSVPEAEAAPFEFSGFYAGAHAGVSDMNADLGAGSDSDGGAMGGLQAGYNFLSGNLIWGVETDVSGIGGDPSAGCGLAANCSIDLDLAASLRPRIGYAVDDFLIYATGGIAAARFDLSTGAGGGSTEGAYGWTVGAGAEYLLGDIVGLKLEYRYMSFSNVDFGGGLPDADIDIHTVIGGINFHF